MDKMNSSFNGLFFTLFYTLTLSTTITCMKQNVTFHDLPLTPSPNITCREEIDTFKRLPNDEWNKFQGQLVTTILNLYLNELEEKIDHYNRHAQPSKYHWDMPPPFNYNVHSDGYLYKIARWIQRTNFSAIQKYINFNLKSKTGNTLLHHATSAAVDGRDFWSQSRMWDLMNGTPESFYNLAKFLLEHGANPNIQNNNGDTAFFNCINGFHDDENSMRTKLIPVFLAAQANPNVCSRNTNVLETLARRQYSEAAKQIIERIDIEKFINKQSEHGETPVMTATIYRNVEFLQLLITAGADLTIKNQCEQTALEFILEYETGEFFQRLTAARTIITIKNQHKQTALERAIEYLKEKDKYSSETSEPNVETRRLNDNPLKQLLTTLNRPYQIIEILTNAMIKK